MINIVMYIHPSNIYYDVICDLYDRWLWLVEVTDGRNGSVIEVCYTTWDFIIVVAGLLQLLVVLQSALSVLYIIWLYYSTGYNL
jgi:hypothetical protein